MTTLTTKVARKIMRKQGVGRTLFNDRLADGSRSLKVWGWTALQYEKAKRKLEKKGCDVRWIELRNYRGGITIRLHVTEPQG